jgi:hypothetical protein
VQEENVGKGLPGNITRLAHEAHFPGPSKLNHSCGVLRMPFVAMKTGGHMLSAVHDPVGVCLIWYKRVGIKRGWFVAFETHSDCAVFETATKAVHIGKTLFASMCMFITPKVCRFASGRNFSDTFGTIHTRLLEILFAETTNEHIKCDAPSSPTPILVHSGVFWIESNIVVTGTTSRESINVMKAGTFAAHVSHTFATVQDVLIGGAKRARSLVSHTTLPPLPKLKNFLIFLRPGKNKRGVE